MKKNEVKIGGVYTAKVSNRMVEVRIDSTNSHGGWSATNIRTGKHIRIKSAQRLRGVATQTAKAKTPDADETPVVGDAKAKTAGKAAVAKAKPKKVKAAKAEKKPKRISALDAAAKVLAKADKPMRAQELVAAMAEQGLWQSPAGKTPHATLYAAMLREVSAKGNATRFKKVDRGLFAFNAKAEA